MNFTELELDESTQAFIQEVRSFLDEHLTDEVHDHEWNTGAGYHAGFAKALAERGWLLPTYPPEQGGAGLSPLHAEILSRELRDRHAPTISMGTTSLVLPAVINHAEPTLRDEVVSGVARGDIRLCLGYTEPDSGSDIAAARTRAVRDGDEWVIDGQKMFTTGAQHCQYAFLLTRTNLDAPKHKGLTMFLCPLDDVEIQAVHTLGGERTNMVFFDGVRINDRYRLGDVDKGWGVLMGPLDAEHGIGKAPVTLEDRGGGYGNTGVLGLHVAEEWARTPSPTDQNRPIDDPRVRRRLARAALDIEEMTAAPGPMGRIVQSERLIELAADLVNLVGPDGLLPYGTDGAIGDGWIEYTHRFAQGTAIYGGTTDVQRNIIAERMLGLPRSSPKG